MSRRIISKMKRIFKGYNTVQVSHMPHIGNIELTNKCPFQCIMCIRTYSMKRSQGFMDLNLFTKIIDELLEVNPISIEKELSLTHFGESMLHKDFDQFIRYAKNKGFKNILLSINPYMLTDDNIDKLLNSGLDKLHISLDGHDNDSFKAIRGGGDQWYDISKSRLDRFLHKKSLNNIKMYVRLGMIDFKHNVESIKKMEQYWRNINDIDEVQVKIFTHWSGVSNEVLNLNDSFMDRKLDMKYVACTQPWWNLTVLWDGRVVPCCGDVEGMFVYGNLNTMSIIDIWNGDKIKVLRQSFLENKVKNELCKNCEYLYE